MLRGPLRRVWLWLEKQSDAKQNLIIGLLLLAIGGFATGAYQAIEWALSERDVHENVASVTPLFVKEFHSSAYEPGTRLFVNALFNVQRPMKARGKGTIFVSPLFDEKVVTQDEIEAKYWETVKPLDDPNGPELATPQGEWSMQFFGAVLTEEAARQLKAGEAAVFMAGIVKYDADGASGLIEFCGITKIDPLVVRLCRQHNGPRR